MAAAISASPNPVKGYGTVTLTLSGAAATTAHSIVISQPSGHSTSIPVMTDGSGGAVTKFVPANNGVYNVTVYVTAQSQVSTTSFNASGASS